MVSNNTTLKYLLKFLVIVFTPPIIHSFSQFIPLCPWIVKVLFNNKHKTFSSLSFFSMYNNISSFRTMVTTWFIYIHNFLLCFQKRHFYRLLNKVFSTSQIQNWNYVEGWNLFIQKYELRVIIIFINSLKSRTSHGILSLIWNVIEWQKKHKMSLL